MGPALLFRPVPGAPTFLVASPCQIRAFAASLQGAHCIPSALPLLSPGSQPARRRIPRCLHALPRSLPHGIRCSRFRAFSFLLCSPASICYPGTLPFPSLSACLPPSHLPPSSLSSLFSTSRPSAPLSLCASVPLLPLSRCPFVSPSCLSHSLFRVPLSPPVSPPPLPSSLTPTSVIFIVCS